MIIHEDGVTRIEYNIYLYRFTVNGNQASIRFTTDPNDVPETGDMIVQNWLVKGSE